ncbi:efflux RND transporter periplasmic adaptor subunit [Teredinibacter waterburyi]|jgi:RND family efflux transporter, MFP subunit|uniref:efflux RND transporter periplasmic adaptor subunit n=1 Tax=Teredinibacter waterburyi TaxID=1500538 RepID=UPI00165F0EA6|nr:efflux RND transporter periplasmic adaptor subunit [Teredinibacter waterburyi]
MKKFISISAALLMAVLFVGTGVFLYKKSQQKPVEYTTTTAEIRSVVKKTVATGKIIPRREVEIKSQVSGVVEKIYIDAGEKVKKGELIAKIEIIPNMERLNAAESQVETAKLKHANAKREFERQKKLFEDRLIPEFEFNKYSLDFELQAETLQAAESNLAIIREGASKKAGKVSNHVKATLEGLILDIPVKEGTFVTETNTFNAGTTIANIANMQDMIFDGTVDEAEVGKIHEGMELLLKIGAMDDQSFVAVLEYISPKGIDDQGTIKFQIKAAVKLRDDLFLRAGYSATADIVLDQADDVLAINERVLIIEKDKIYVEVETAPQVFEKREIKTGLSDGIYIQVLDGITEQTKIKKP